jgi:uracil-DNA glycosylase family 4
VSPERRRDNNLPAPLTVLEQVRADIVSCRACPRLVEWREQVARERRAAFRNEQYWGKPVPGFGDPSARLLLCGLAPAAHGGNRTGRPFTGDRSGDWLFAALHRAGFANQSTSVRRDDDLALRDAYISGVVRCCPPANKPIPAERDVCLGFLSRELQALPSVVCVLCLGAYAWDGFLRAVAGFVNLPRPRPRFRHAGESAVGRYTLLGCYHPSQHNTCTGRLTADMLDAVLARARQLLDWT